MNTQIKATLLSVEKVNSEKSYNAFTDLIFFHNKFWIAYRSGTKHVFPDGKIIICCSTDGDHWEQKAIVEQENLDCRDPRLAIIQGKLILLHFTLEYYQSNPYRFTSGDCYFYEILKSGECKFISKFIHLADPIVLWALVEYKEIIYVSGYSYHLGHSSHYIWKSESFFGPWEEVAMIPEQILHHKTGFNETDIVLKNDKMVMFNRVDKDSFNRIKPNKILFKQAKEAQKLRRTNRKISRFQLPKDEFVVSQAEYPFTSWIQKKYSIFLKGPRAIAFDDGFLLIGRTIKNARDRHKKRQITLFFYDGEFHALLTLNEGKDGSYAGMIWDPKDPTILCISYYSDHVQLDTSNEGKMNDIWFARIKITK